MKLNKIGGLAALAATLVAISSFAVPTFADSATAQAGQTVAFTAQPWIVVGNSSASFLTVNYQNQSPVTVNGTLYAVVHNIFGATVQVAYAPIVGIAPGQNASATFVLTVPLDAYTVDIFAVSSSGWSISATTNSTIVA